MENIIETRIEFKNGEVTRVTVLADFTPSILTPGSDVRALFITSERRGGYAYIQKNKELSELIQETVDYGMETVDRDEIFPNWKNKFLLQKT